MILWQECAEVRLPLGVNRKGESYLWGPLGLGSSLGIAGCTTIYRSCNCLSAYPQFLSGWSYIVSYRKGKSYLWGPPGLGSSLGSSLGSIAWELHCIVACTTTHKGHVRVCLHTPSSFVGGVIIQEGRTFSLGSFELGEYSLGIAGCTTTRSLA